MAPTHTVRTTTTVRLHDPAASLLVCPTKHGLDCPDLVPARFTIHEVVPVEPAV
jgi:hypothetical protein